MRARKSSGERQAEIVAAAVMLADKLGPERLTTATLADAVGVSQAALFKHFPTKQAIWEAIVAWIADHLEARWSAAAPPGAGAVERLRVLLRRHLELVQSVPAIPSILLSRELHSRHEALRAGLLSLMGRFHEHLSAVIADGRRKELRADIDPGRAAFLIIGLVQGLVLRWSLSGRSFDLAAELDPMLDILLRGLQQPSEE